MKVRIVLKPYSAPIKIMYPQAASRIENPVTAFSSHRYPLWA